ncbi:MAG: hypothetical protein JWM33_1001 [Caulobacteraceae bacterium]|nr:hypothetical protein [Caulobacteraceae bacterium]
MQQLFSAWFGGDPVVPRKAVEVGWLLDTEKARFVWNTPRRVGTDRSAEFGQDARLFEITCPFDLRLGCRLTTDGHLALIDLDADNSAIRSKVLEEHLRLQPRAEWRHPDRPVIQFYLPYVFVADEPVQMIQSAPYDHFSAAPWPGLVVGGRMPIHIWPRKMNWGFEWWSVTEPLVFRRGDPWFYVRFDGMDPNRPIQLVEAAMTPDLDDYMKGMAGVVTYTNQTYSLFKTAQERRPTRLLTHLRR